MKSPHRSTRRKAMQTQPQRQPLRRPKTARNRCLCLPDGRILTLAEARREFLKKFWSA